MLSFDDPRWRQLRGGYGSPYDPRKALLSLERGTDVLAAWSELWEELHHQGDVGEASYAAVHIWSVFIASSMHLTITPTLLQSLSKGRDGSMQMPKCHPG